MSFQVAVRHRQGDFTLDASFTTGPGVTALFGRSGAGKSTLAGLIAGLRRPSEGRIALDGVILADTASGTFVPQRRRRIGVVFQEGRLFPHLTVRQNLLFGRRFLPASEQRGDATAVVDLLGIGALLDRSPRNLSGGEQQRVAIGRALLMQPRALIMDEPLAAIDQARRAEILPYLDRMRAETNIPMVYISHAVEEVARLADAVIVLDAGKVTAAGATADILSRLDLLPLDETETGVILTAKVSAIDEERGVAALAHAAGPMTVPLLAAPVGATVRVRVHARDVALAVGEPGRLSIRNRLPATVSALQARRTGIDVRLDLGGEVLLARLTADAVQDLGLAAGSKVTALIKAVAVEGYLVLVVIGCVGMLRRVPARDRFIIGRLRFDPLRRGTVGGVFLLPERRLGLEEVHHVFGCGEGGGAMGGDGDRQNDVLARLDAAGAMDDGERLKRPA